MTDSTYKDVSLWFDTLPEPVTPRAPLAENAQVDVAIVGAGFSGLWTAYYLARLRPNLRIALLEAEVAGFGASGRNGGWCVGLLAGLEGLLLRGDRRAAGLALQRAAFDAVDEVGRIASAEKIDCDYRKGGSVRVAVTPGQRTELHERVRVFRELLSPDDFRLLEPAECESYVRVRGALGGFYTPHCAALHPARLARGLASRVEQLGVRILERTRVTGIEPGRVTTGRFELRAGVIVRATEAYTAQLRGARRALLPMHSWMIATEPLSASLWQEIGLARAETFGDGRQVTTYGQRTGDGRIAFGGLGSYRYGSGIERRFSASHARFRELERILCELLPVLRGTRITHRWGGALGIPRDWRPRVGLDRERGLAWIGGYVGEGVAGSNLAGRTLAELVAGADTERTRLALVAKPARAWEPEPLRFLAVRGTLALANAHDRASARGRDTGWRERLIARLSGRSPNSS